MYSPGDSTKLPTWPILYDSPLKKLNPVAVSLASETLTEVPAYVLYRSDKGRIMRIHGTLVRCPGWKAVGQELSECCEVSESHLHCFAGALVRRSGTSVPNCDRHMRGFAALTSLSQLRSTVPITPPSAATESSLHGALQAHSLGGFGAITEDHGNTRRIRVS